MDTRAMRSGDYRVPHPFPYQGSKRAIAHHILPYFPRTVRCLIEPFCGSAAVSIAAAASGRAERFWLNDINVPLMNLWSEMLEHPAQLAKCYEELWNEQHSNRKDFFFRIRDEFNVTHQPHHLLYLLARIVKGSIRYSSNGKFNQSPDNRRSGMRPKTMWQQILAVSSFLSKRTRLSASDFRLVVTESEGSDLVYMDPPYQGTSFTRDHRYYNGLSYKELIDALEMMNRENISYIISYDGQTGTKNHGNELPDQLSLKHLHIHAGRSSQSTLLGKTCETVESLYLSPALVDRLDKENRSVDRQISFQQRLDMI